MHIFCFCKGVKKKISLIIYVFPKEPKKIGENYNKYKNENNW